MPARRQEPDHGAVPAQARSAKPVTLCIDVGGTGIKAERVDPGGRPLGERARQDTSYPLRPDGMVEVFSHLATQTGNFDRVSVGFPGVVREGQVITAPHFVRDQGDGSPVDPDLTAAWSRFDLASATSKALGKPTRVGNDAEVQGMAVISGKGLEVVVTLGTGFGSAVFYQGRLGIHLELAQHPCLKGKTYNEYVGDAARRQLGGRRWNRRVHRALELVRVLLIFDHLYVGGGNSARVQLELPPDITLVDNSAGLLGGVRLWDRDVGGPSQVG
ncbi:MAG: ROK family protein [Candidatus Dormibacteria bacterium]